ncbi:hypothetical protein LJC22_04250, partial [Desulfosarcina sp. OttesenSCG-928-G10]|nr:hypothetical protein [Desulfosarcina sp. OttesenSCG-928-G10]
PVTGDDHYENFSHVLLAGLETLNERISQASRLTAGMADLVRTKLADGQALKNADKLFLTGLLFCLEKRGVVFEELTKTGQLQEVSRERFEQ